MERGERAADRGERAADPESQDARRQRRRRVWVLLGAFAGLQALFFVLLVVGQAVPDRPIVDRLADAVRAGTYGPSSLPDRMGGISDSFTECVIVGTGLGAPADESAWSRAVRMPRISNCKLGADQILQLEAGASMPKDEYYKYWAGYTAVTRPVLALSGMEGLRIFSGAAVLGGFVVMLLGLRRATSWPVALALSGPLVLASNLMSTPSTGLSNALALAVLFGGVGAVSYGARHSTGRALVLTGVAAAVYCYVDLLTNPPLAWAFTSAAVGLATWWRLRNPRHVLGATLAAGVVWIVSFGTTWVSRWVIAALFLGPSEVYEKVRENVAFRTGGDWSTVEPGLGQAVVANTRWWLDRVPTAEVVLVLSLLVVLAALALVLLRHGPAGLTPVGILALPVLLVIAWYVALNNHSQIHTFFTYRAVPGAVGVVVAACVAGVHRVREGRP